LKVIIDCDPGNGVPGSNVDDGLAIALAVAASDRIELEAITIVAGNTTRDIGYAVTETMLASFDVDVPIYLGADRPLLEDPGRWRAHLDRDTDPIVAELWRSTPRPQPLHAAPSRSAAQAIGEIVTAHPGEVTIVAIGPLTNIALALQLCPDVASAVSRIVIMGGVFDVDGYLVDTNFGYDPEAAAAVLGSGAAITLVPMDVTTQTLLTDADLARLEAIDNPITRCLVPTLRPWLDYMDATRTIGGMWIHDVVNVALLLDPTIATSRRASVAVELAPGLSRGRTARWTPGALQSRGGRPFTEPDPIDVLTSVDNSRLLTLITTVIEASSARTTQASADVRQESYQ
jgi:inosine-uridine nucleoside N-ribohydrolase